MSDTTVLLVDAWNSLPVADPGFPVDSRGGYVSKFLYVKKKESGPLGEWAGHAP